MHFFITGASGGVGLDLSKTLLEKKEYQECKLSLQFHSNEAFLQKLENGNQNIGGNKRFHGVRADVAVEEQVCASFEKANQVYGYVDTLVVCHGIWPEEDIGVKDMSLERFQSTLSVNLIGTFLYVKYFLKQVERYYGLAGGKDLPPPSIVLIGSTAGKYGEAWHSDYACSKSALMSGFMYSVKNEIVKIHPLGRINTVSPGWIRTAMAERALADKDLLYQAFATSPLKKVSEPQDITQAILFLADPKKSGNITGVSLDVNAGMEGRLLNKMDDF